MLTLYMRESKKVPTVILTRKDDKKPVLKVYSDYYKRTQENYLLKLRFVDTKNYLFSDKEKVETYDLWVGYTNCNTTYKGEQRSVILCNIAYKDFVASGIAVMKPSEKDIFSNLGKRIALKRATENLRGQLRLYFSDDTLYSVNKETLADSFRMTEFALDPPEKNNLQVRLYKEETSF